MIRRNYYFVLGVLPTESARGLRQAFRTLVKRYHPERVGPRGMRLFQEILEAYHVLADPVQRSSYDRGLAHAEGWPASRSSVQADMPPTLPQLVVPVYRTTAPHLAFANALARIVRRWTQGSADPQAQWEAIDVQVVLSPDDAIRGGMVVLTVPSCTPCPTCRGSGCEKGWPCQMCQGTGLVEMDEEVQLAIPPAIGDGTRLEVPLPGLGIHGFYLRVQIRVAPVGAAAA